MNKFSKKYIKEFQIQADRAVELKDEIYNPRISVTIEEIEEVVGRVYVVEPNALVFHIKNWLKSIGVDVKEKQ